jgi:ferritin-like metal-binding protein YciE
MSVTTIQELFVEELRDIYFAEKQLVKALPKMARGAAHPELKAAFTRHLEETRGQVDRLEQVFELLDLSKRARRCEAMEGLLDESKTMMEEIKDPHVLDAGMIIGAQKVEHYEIAAYGALVALAIQLGHAKAVPLLRQTLEQEKAADHKLNELALGFINKDAAGGARRDNFRAA